MSACVEITQAGQIVSSTICDYYILTPQEMTDINTLLASFDSVTPEQILYVYSWGMGAILLPFSIAFAVRWAIKLIRLA